MRVDVGVVVVVGEIYNSVVVVGKIMDLKLRPKVSGMDRILFPLHFMGATRTDLSAGELESAVEDLDKLEWATERLPGQEWKENDETMMERKVLMLIFCSAQFSCTEHGA